VVGQAVEVGGGLPHPSAQVMNLARECLDDGNKVPPLLEQAIEPLPRHGIRDAEVRNPSDLVLGQHGEIIAKV
jgi:hypothetical protein